MIDTVFRHAPLLLVSGFFLAWIASMAGLLPARKKQAGFALTGYDKYCNEASDLCREAGMSSEATVALMNRHRREGIESLRDELMKCRHFAFTEGPTMRSGFSDGPQTTKPAIEPKGQGYQPRPHAGPIIPPPRNP